jgi:hypothetical protein
MECNNDPQVAGPNKYMMVLIVIMRRRRRILDYLSRPTIAIRSETFGIVVCAYSCRLPKLEERRQCIESLVYKVVPSQSSVTLP